VANIFSNLTNSFTNVVKCKSGCHLFVAKIRNLATHTVNIH